MNLLALDLGTTTGWALKTHDGNIRSGSTPCALRPGEGRGQRWLKFRAMLSEFNNGAGELQVVYFEDIKMHKGVLAAHVYGGFLAHLETWCELQKVQLIGVGFGAIKKNWTGKGNSDKATMIAVAKAKGFNPVDDNEADALAILALALVLEREPAEKMDITTACPALWPQTEGAF
jgi:Holliday junction resolvasome RuvABC endonuclease subunit